MSYPKALYKGTKKKRKLKTAKSYDDEQRLRSLGYVSYAELPDDVPINDNQNTQDSQECNELKQKWGELPSLQARVVELVTPLMEKFNGMTAKQLQDELKSRSVAYKSSDSKSELLALLQNHIISGGSANILGPNSDNADGPVEFEPSDQPELDE